MDRLKKQLNSAVQKHFESCKQVGRYLTEHPELGMDTPLAKERIAAFLEENGYIVERDYLGVENSFLAIEKEKTEFKGNKIVVLCEMDALDEIGHACGHSVSSAISLLAALAIKEAYPDFPFRIDIMGTPGEEYPGGKIFLQRAGAFEGYELAAMVHLMGGGLTIAEAQSRACNDRLITFYGKSSHASAAPCEGLNALNAARLYMDAMDMWRQHIPSTSQFHGVFEDGGVLPSIVPDKAQLNYYFRAKTLNELKDLCDKSEMAMKGAAMATGTKAESRQVYETYADRQMNQVSAEILNEIFSVLNINYKEHTDLMITTDIGGVDQWIPTLHPFISCTEEDIPIHDKKFAELMKTESADAALKNGGMILSMTIARFAFEPDKFEAFKNYHADIRKDS